MPLDFDDEELEEELGNIYDELNDDHEEYEHFYTKPLGGRWTSVNKGVAADRYLGTARSGFPKQWCAFFKFPSQKSFAFNRYGRPESAYLAREYCRRGEYFFMLYLELGVPLQDCRYSVADLQSYDEGLEWLDFVVTVDVASVVWEAIEMVRGLVPVNP